MPIFEPGLLTDAKIVSVASMVGTCLILRLRPPSIMNAPVLTIVLYLLDINHQPGEVHVIVERRKLTLLLQISVDSFEELSHLISLDRYKGSSIPGNLNKLQGILLDCHGSLLKVNKLLNLGLPCLSTKEPFQIGCLK